MTTDLVSNNRILSTVIASQSRWRSSSLSAVIAAMPCVEVIGQVQDIMTLVEGVSVSHVDLVVLDASFTNGELAAVIQRIKTLSPLTTCIVIAPYRNEQYAVAEAVADVVLLDGFRTETLAEILQQLAQSPARSEAE